MKLVSGRSGHRATSPVALENPAENGKLLGLREEEVILVQSYQNQEDVAPSRSAQVLSYILGNSIIHISTKEKTAILTFY